MAEAQLDPSQMPHPSQPLGFKRFYRQRYNQLWGAVGLAGFFVLWETFTRFGWVDPFFVSSPGLVWRAAVSHIAGGKFLIDVTVSMQEYLYGMVLAVALGVPLGLVAGWYRYPYACVNPFLAALYATPAVGFVPLVVMWFGIGLASKVFLVFFGAVFPIVINTLSGVRSIDQELLRVARSFKASDTQIFRTIALPASVPVILGGIRLGMGQGMLGLIVGEYYASRAGLGYWIFLSHRTLSSDQLFAGIVTVGALGVILVAMVTWLEHRFAAWRISADGRN